VTAEIFEKLAMLRDEGLPILLVEQKAPAALKMATRVYVLSLGRIAASLDTDQITTHEDLAKYYFT
jgi:branched-chain amino acid transport system ATP-binding protein